MYRPVLFWLRYVSRSRISGEEEETVRRYLLLLSGDEITPAMGSVHE